MYQSFNKEIPTVDMPSIKDFEIVGKEEDIISVSKSGIKVISQYYAQGIPGAYKDCYARETVVELLLRVNESLPKGYQLVVWDAYRPICIQERLWKYYRQDIKNKYKDRHFTEEELDFKTSFFVSKPSRDIKHPSLHNTGGAVDVTIMDPNGKLLDMGTNFDDFTNAAWANHFEVYAHNETVRDNRRLLYNAMIKQGFTNLPSEWWHYDYGTKFWGFFKGQLALYEGILDIDFPNRFPLV